MSSLPNEMPGLNASRKPKSHDLVTEDDRLFLTAVAINRVDDLLHLFLPEKTVYQIKRRFRVQRQKRIPAGRDQVSFQNVGPNFLTFVVDLKDTRAVILACRCTSPASSACCNFLNGSS